MTTLSALTRNSPPRNSPKQNGWSKRRIPPQVTDIFLLENSATPPRHVCLRPCEATLLTLLLRLRNPKSAEVLRKPSSYRSCTPFGQGTVSKGLALGSHPKLTHKNASAKPSPLFRAYEVVPSHHADPVGHSAE